jgi:hypothetical protein
LSTEQYGLRIGLKTDNGICKLTAEILNVMNNKLLGGGGSICGLEKGFGCVDHGMVLWELKLCGVNGKNLAPYKLYLHKRYIGTAIYSDGGKGYRVSGWGKVRRGVRQDSNYFIQINDLHKINKNPVHITFADDTSMLFAQSNVTVQQKHSHKISNIT